MISLAAVVAGLALLSLALWCQAKADERAHRAKVMHFTPRDHGEA